MGVYKVKQQILLRSDLKDTWKKFPGKMGAMIAHASVGVLTKMMRSSDGGKISLLDTNGSDTPDLARFEFDVTIYVYDWIIGDFAKVVLNCPTLDQLLNFEEQAKRKGIPNCLITDNGTTVFGQEKTIVALGLGPYKSDVLEELTKDLKLY